jgi:hypothetical protein
MESTDDGKEAADTALRDLRVAEAELNKGASDLHNAEGEIAAAERNIEKAEAEIKKAEAHRRREIEVKVDGHVKHVLAGTYLVSAFKELIGVAAARELDVVEHDTLKPLDDNAEITVHECEVFVSHVRTGGSS